MVVLVGGAGLFVNGIMARVLHGAATTSLNVRAALRHVLADLLSSAGVVLAGLLVLGFGWEAADPAVSLVIAALVLVSAWDVLRESVGVLLEATPRGVDADAVGTAMAAAPGVVEVHDLHIWTITSGFPSLSAHVTVERGRGLPRDPARHGDAAPRALRARPHDAPGRARDRARAARAALKRVKAAGGHGYTWPTTPLGFD